MHFLNLLPSSQLPTVSENGVCIKMHYDFTQSVNDTEAHP